MRNRIKNIKKKNHFPCITKNLLLRAEIFIKIVISRKLENMYADILNRIDRTPIVLLLVLTKLNVKNYQHYRLSAFLKSILQDKQFIGLVGLKLFRR